MMITWLISISAIIQLCLCAPVFIPQCDMILSESIPEDLTYENSAPSTFPIWRAWSDLITKSTGTIKITSFYWTLLNADVNSTKKFPSSKLGEAIFKLLKEKSTNVSLKIVQNDDKPQNDLKILGENALVDIHYINFPKFLGKGIQHSKVWIGDESRAFIGSPNMDWRSLSQVKELGVYIPNCPIIVGDIDKFWGALRLLSTPNATIPKQWPSSLLPAYNHTHPLVANINGALSRVYVATSPPLFNPPHRTDDLTAILTTIINAKKYVCISVMDMFPLELNYEQGKDRFWPLIENELKTQAIDGNVTVRLLISWWRHSHSMMLDYLRSLKSLAVIKDVDIAVKIFIVPAFNDEQREIPFSRVSHSKYMVTDNTAYIGTSNWSGDYFESTGGASLVVEDTDPDTSNKYSLRSKLKEVFDTDWYSIYAHDLW